MTGRDRYIVRALLVGPRCLLKAVAVCVHRQGLGLSIVCIRPMNTSVVVERIRPSMGWEVRSG